MDRARRPENAWEPMSLDYPTRSGRSVDRPLDDPSERARRRRATNGDRSAHRVHYALYEDMVN